MSSDDIKYDNYTLYGIHDRTERGLLASYSYIMVISSVIGDTLILVGSCGYSAIKLPKIMVVFIQHLAAADLLFSLVRVLPGAISLTANNDVVFGNVVCFPAFFLSLCSVGAGCFLVSALAAAKFLLVKYPLRSVHFTKRDAHILACVIWICSICLASITIVNDKEGIEFSYQTYNCQCSHSSNPWGPIWLTFKFIAVGSLIFIANMVTIVSSVMLIIVAKRMADSGPGGLQWQGVMTVLLTVAVYVATTLPVAVYFIGSKFVREDPPGVFHIYFFRFVVFSAYLNVVSNVYIYTLTLTSFREFLKSMIKKLSEFFSRNVPQI